MPTESDLVPYSTWRHVKTGGLYVVLGVARCSTNGEREGVERSVVYVSTTHGHLCYRELSEFLSGRFEAVSGPASQTELWHFGGIPFRPLCGANLPNQSTTSVRENVTCPACRAKMEDKP